MSWLEWLIKIKLRYNIGGSWLADSIIGGVIGASLVKQEYVLIILVIIARLAAGTILIRMKVPQKENELQLSWLNPYMNRKLTVRGGGIESRRNRRH